MVQNTFQSMTEKFTIAYVGAEIEAAMTLNRPSVAGDDGKWSIQWIEIYSANAAAGAYVQVLRKNSASLSGERDVTNATSVNVLVGEFYYDAASSLKRFELQNTADLDDTGLRIRLRDFGGVSHTVYVNVHYYYTVS